MSDRRMRGLEADTSTIDAYNAEHKKYVYDTDKGHNVYRVGAVTPSYPAGGELIHFVMTKNDTSQIDPALRYATISPVGNIAISGDITVSTTKHIGISAGAARVSYPSSGVVSVMDADFGIGTETPSEQFVLYKAGGGNALEIQSTATTTRLSQNRLELDRNNSEGSSDIQMSNNAAQIYYDDSALYLGTNIDKPVRIQQNNISIVEFPSAGNIKVLGNGSSTLTLEETGSTNVASISFNGTDLVVHTNNNGITRINGSGGTAANSTVKLLVNGAIQATSSSIPKIYLHTQTYGDSGSFEFDSTSSAIKCRINDGSEIFSAAYDGIFRIGPSMFDAWEGAYIRENIRGGNLQISQSNVNGRIGPVLYFLETHNGDKASLNFTGEDFKYSHNGVEFFKTNGVPAHTQASISSSSVGFLVDGYGSDLTSNVFVGNTNYGLQVIPNTSLSIRSGGADKIKIDNAGTTTIYNNLLIQSSVSNYHNTLAGSVGDTRLKQYGGGNVIVGLEPEFGGHNDIQLTVYGPMEAYTLLSNVLTLTPGSTPSVPVEGMIYVDYLEDALKIYYNDAWKIIASL